MFPNETTAQKAPIMKPIFPKSELGSTNAPRRHELRALGSRRQDFKRGPQFKLAGSSAGGLVLHQVSAVVTDHFAWHFQDIARELARH